MLMSDLTHTCLACKAHLNMSIENALYKFITITITITKMTFPLEQVFVPVVSCLQQAHPMTNYAKCMQVCIGLGLVCVIN